MESTNFSFVQVDFSPLPCATATPPTDIDPPQSLTSSIHPVFNNDGLHYTPSFSLPVEKVNLITFRQKQCNTWIPISNCTKTEWPKWVLNVMSWYISTYLVCSQAFTQQQLLLHMSNYIWWLSDSCQHSYSSTAAEIIFFLLRNNISEPKVQYFNGKASPIKETREDPSNKEAFKEGEDKCKVGKW